MTTDRPSPALLVEDLHASYGGGVITALEGVTLSVGEGETVAVLGANGAGKTTLVRGITGLLTAHNGSISSGTVSYRGKSLVGLSSMRTVRAGIGQIPEGRVLFGGLTVDENLRSGALRAPRAQVEEDLEKMYNAMPRIRERRTQRAGFLSGGEQQMVAIGRALMSRPSLLLSDELSLGLAPMITRDLYELLGELTRTLSMSWLIIEQNAALALEFSSHAYVLESGAIASSGDSRTLENSIDLGAIYLGR